MTKITPTQFLLTDELEPPRVKAFVQLCIKQAGKKFLLFHQWTGYLILTRGSNTP